ncbi:MAG TPA: folylpolyglutamate synthase/dihydrofolate synthase family protein [Chitinispirillaceae bacterium]|nr:folylpolyglutamate synthase/dihydrofolate synthase family protein [Chitinispirillaceae bacterium]
MNLADEIRQNLFSRTGYGIKYDLERMIKAANECGNPQQAFKSFHIAGTNGKGSTCAYIDAMLRGSGFKTGLYTSPHIIDFEERFQIDGKTVTQALWIEVYSDLKKIIEMYDLTFFEATTLMAFEMFRRQNVVWAVIETGLGGRLDATNIIKPAVSVICTIDIEHKEYLGDTIEKIAFEKCGIIKDDTPVVMLYNENSSVMQEAAAVCSQKNAELTIVNPERFTAFEHETGVTVEIPGSVLTVPMKGKFQIANLLLAVHAFRLSGLILGKESIHALSQTLLPGRLQIVTCNNKTVVLDVGHNPQASSKLVAEIKKRYSRQTVCMVIGIMKDKDYQSMIHNYCTVADRIVFTQPEIPRAASVEALAACMNDTIRYVTRKSVKDACNEAINGSEDIVCITGSFHTVGEACIALGIQ